MDQHGPLVKMIDQDANDYADQMDIECRTRWKNMDDEGETSTLERLQGLDKRSLDQSDVGKRIEYLCNFDMDEGAQFKNNDGVQERLRQYLMGRG